MILDRVRVLAGWRYSWRNGDVLYVHQLVYPRDMAFRRPAYNGMMALGELIHLGVRVVLEEAPRMCRVLRFYEDETAEIYEAVRGSRLEALIHGAHDAAVVVCGEADALFSDGLSGIPVEVKTTRKDIRRYDSRWALQAEIYAWLYHTPLAYLVVINVVDGVERVWRCPAITDDRMHHLVLDWFRGKDPVSYARSCEPREEVVIDERPGDTRSLFEDGSLNGRGGGRGPSPAARETGHPRPSSINIYTRNRKENTARRSRHVFHGK